MSKTWKFILSWNWSFLIHIVFAIYFVELLTNPDMNLSSQTPHWLICFCAISSIVFSSVEAVKATLKSYHDNHTIPPPAAICKTITAHEALVSQTKAKMSPLFIKESDMCFIKDKSRHFEIGYHQFKNGKWVRL